MQPQKPKRKPPERKCTGCGEKFKKIDLIRIVRTPEGNVENKRTGTLSGRGAYICRDLECLRRSRKARRLESNLECSISSETYDVLDAEIHGAGDVQCITTQKNLFSGCSGFAADRET